MIFFIPCIKLRMKLFILLLLVSTLFCETNSTSTNKPRRIYPTGIRLKPSSWEKLRSSGYDREMKHPDQEVPEHFDARERWPECDSIREIKDQGDCGSCWAVVLTSVLDDRLCISSNGTKKVRTSSEDLLTCCSYCTDPRDGQEVCQRGADPVDPLSYMANTGVVTGGELHSGIGCKPYAYRTFSGIAPKCERQCTNSNYTIPYKEDKIFIKAARVSKNTNVKQLQIEILKNGPVLACIAMTKTAMWILDDKNFTDVYFRQEKAKTNHVVKIIGWGIERKRINYWLIANSYGEDFGGLGGFFKLKRGVNLLGIEEEHIGLITEFAEDPGDHKDDEASYYPSGKILKQSLAFWAIFWNVALLVINQVW